MAKAFRYQHLRSLVPGTEPTAEQLREGEIAVNLAASKEKMFLKNTDNEIVEFISENEIDSKIEASTIAPDEEDVTKESNVLKFKNRSTSHGMGKVIVRMDKTFAEQLTQSNTIYEIRYDFNLGNDIVEIPNDSVLEFVGGSLSNGTISGSNTQIVANRNIIFDGITIEGTWNVPYITSAWFGDADENNGLKNVFALQDENIFNTLTVEEGNYTVSCDNSGVCLVCKSNLKLIIVGTISLASNPQNPYYIIYANGVSNVEITGSGSIVGDRATHDYETNALALGPKVLSTNADNTPEGRELYTDSGVIIGTLEPSESIATAGYVYWVRNSLPASAGDIYTYYQCVYNSGSYAYKIVNTHEHGMGITIEGESRNICVNGITIKDCTGDGIYVRGNSKSILIENCHIYNCRRQGISIVYGTQITIDNCNIHNIDGTAPRSCIDIEPNSNCIADDIRITNCQFSNPRYRCVVLSAKSKIMPISNVLIEGCYFGETFRALTVHCRDTSSEYLKNITIRRNVISSIPVRGLMFWVVKNLVFEYNTVIANDISEYEAGHGTFYLRGCDNVRCCKNDITTNYDCFRFVECTSVNVSENNIVSHGPLFGSNNDKMTLYKNNITLFSGANLYGINLIGNTIIASSTGNITSRLLSLWEDSNIIDNIINIEEGVSLSYVLYARGNNIIKGNTFVGVGSDIVVDSVVGYNTPSTNVVCLFNDFVNISANNGFIKESEAFTVYSNNHRYGSTLPSNPENGAYFMYSTLGKPVLWNKTKWIESDGATASVKREGSSSERPSSNDIYPPFEYFDTDLGKPIIWNGTKWVESDGATAGVMRNGASSERPSSNRIYPSFEYLDTNLGKIIVWNGDYWIDTIGTRITYGRRYMLTNISASNGQQPDANSPFTTVLTADEGYSLPSTITVKMNNVTLTVETDYTYDQTTGEVVILGTGGTGGVTGDIIIRADGIEISEP